MSQYFSMASNGKFVFNHVLPTLHSEHSQANKLENPNRNLFIKNSVVLLLEMVLSFKRPIEVTDLKL